MSKSTADASGVNPAASGSDDQKDTEELEVDASGKEDKVAYATYQKVLNEAKKAKAKLEQVEADKKTAKDKELKDKENFKQMVDDRDKELAEAKAKLADMTNGLQAAQKMQAVVSSLAGELEEQYWGLIDLSAIAVDPETGVPDAMSVKKYAKSFETKYSKVITKPNGAKLPADAANGSGNSVPSYAEWTKMSYKDQQKNLAAVMARETKKN